LVAQFSSGVLTQANAVNNLSQIRIPEQITMSATMKHEVVLNGASVLTQLQPALLAIVDQAIGETLRKHISLQQRLEQPV
jgi:putative aminopeptidase FrvX